MTQDQAPVRIGVAGLGVMGRNHCRVLNDLREADLVVGFDPDPAVAQAATAYGAEPITTAEAFLNAGLEAAVVATPNKHHAELGCELLARGIAVLVEKPLAADMEGAQQLINAAKATDTPLMVGHVERFNPAVETVKNAIADDDIISIQITRVGPFPPRMGEVGVVIDLAVHDIDIIRHLTGSEIVEVQPQLARTRAEREDTALLQFRTERGVIAQINTNWVTPYKARILQVATRQKFVVADLITRQVSEYFDYHTDGSYSTRTLNTWPIEPLKAELSAFIDSVRNGTPPAVSGEDGLANLEVALRCLETA